MASRRLESFGMGTFIPFEASYYLNGHAYIEGQLRRAGVEFRKSDNAFASVPSVEALQKAADSFTPEVIQPWLNYWTMVLGPKCGAGDRRAAGPARSQSSNGRGALQHRRNLVADLLR